MADSTKAPLSTLVALGAFYAFGYGGVGVMFPFLALLFEARGVPPEAIGPIMGLVPICGLFVPPLWGLAADALQARVLFLRIAAVGAALGAFSLGLAHQMPAVLGAMLLFCFFRAPTMPMADAATHAALAKDGARFGRVRLWGSFGYAAFVALGGALGGSKRPELLFPIATLAFVASAASTVLFAHPPPPERRPQVLAETFEFVKRERFLLLFAAGALHYMAHGAYDVFIGLHLAHLGFDDAFIGRAVASGVIAEIGIMFFSPRIFDRFAPTTLMLVGSSASILRWIGLATAQQGWIIFLIQPLHAFSYGIWFLGLVKYVQDRAPGHLRTSLQGLTQGSLGLGTTLGYVGGGWLFARGGGSLLFGAAAVIAGAGLFVYAIVWMRAARKLQAAVVASALFLFSGCSSSDSDAGAGTDAGPNAGDAGPNTGDAGPNASDAGSNANDAGSGTSPYFPAGAFFTRDVSNEPPASNSAAIIGALEAAGGFGLGRIQIDFSIDVLTDDGSTARSMFEQTGDYFDPDCDPAPVPLPAGGNIEGEDGYECTGDGDCHLIVWVPSAQRLYEMWRANVTGGTFYGGCLAIWDSTRVYPDTGRGDQCSSADAAGFPIAPLLFNADEIAAGEIRHAIRFILPNDRVRASRYVRPATHGTRTTGDADAPPYGVHFRLRRDYPLASLPNEPARIVARALQRYGMYHADGGNVALTAQSDRHTAHTWSEVGLEPRDLDDIQPGDFEVIDHGLDIPVTFDCRRTPIGN